MNGRAWNSTLPASPGPKRKTRLRGRNAKRHTAEWLREHGSVDRVKWVKTLACIIADQHTCEGPIENAHIKGDGTSRKADARFIVPACRLAHRGTGGMHAGIETFAARYGLDLEAEAARIQTTWERIA